MANKIKASNIDTNAITADSISYPLTTFSSTGIDDNATSTAITITSGNDVCIGSTNAGVGGLIDLSIGNTSSAGGITLWSPTNVTHSIGFGDGYTGTDRYRGYLEYDHAGDSMRFATSATERMRIDSSGRLVIGTTSAVTASKLTINGEVYQYQTANGTLNNPLTNGGYFQSINGTARSGMRFTNEALSNTSMGIVFECTDTGGSPTERMRIDSSGRVLINGTQSTSNTPLQVNVNGGNGSSGFFGVFYNGSNIANQTAGYYLGRTNNSFTSTVDGSGNPRDNIIVVAGASGGVQLTSGSTSWSAFSDERYKTITENITNGLDKISNWRTVIGRYNSDDVSKRRSFLIAQDVEQTFPEAVITQDSGQETEQKYLSYTDTIPVLVKALQEAKTKIEELEAKITALENA